MSESNKCVKGYKIFDPDWKCRNKQYECCNAFEEDLKPIICEQGMHFCYELRDCFLNYPMADETYHYAEVIAYGDIDSKYPNACTNKMLIVQEIPYNEVVSTFDSYSNVNTGGFNKGHLNTGILNCGDCNSGNNNYGSYNTGDNNEGYCNVGTFNNGYYNTGDRNVGNYNTGSSNWGSWNSGFRNRGHSNSGRYNIGSYNSGDYNCTNYSSGIFNTVEESTIMMFNKPSDWTYWQWFKSDARHILDAIMNNSNVPTKAYNYEDEPEHSESKYTYYHVSPNMDYSKCQVAWQNLDWKDKVTVMSLPNFNPNIFKECTGIDVAADWEKFKVDCDEKQE